MTVIGITGPTGAGKLEKNKLYNGKSSISDSSNGIYLGTDGIALCANSIFRVTPQGNLTAKSGTIGGATIQSDSIRASNDNWWIASDGSASFKNVYISDNSYFGSSANNPFSGTTIPHIQTIAADYIKVNYLDAVNANIDDLQATKASVSALDAANAKISNLETDKLSASEFTADNISAMNISVKAANISGTLSANKISAGTVNGYHVDWKPIMIVNAVSFSKQDINIPDPIKDGWKTWSVVTDISYSQSYLYMMCADWT